MNYYNVPRATLLELTAEWHRVHFEATPEGVYVSFSARTYSKDNKNRKARHKIVLRQKGTNLWRDDKSWRWYRGDEPMLGIGLDFTSEETILDSWAQYETDIESELDKHALNMELLDYIRQHTQFGVEAMWLPTSSGVHQLYGWVRTSGIRHGENPILRAEWVEFPAEEQVGGQWESSNGRITINTDYRTNVLAREHVLLHELGHAFHHHTGSRDVRTAVIHELEAELFAVKAQFRPEQVNWIASNIKGYAPGGHAAKRYSSS